MGELASTDLLHEEPSRGPFIYDARPEDLQFMHSMERLLLEKGRSGEIPLENVGVSATCSYQMKRGKWSFEMVNIEEETIYTLRGATVFSLFERGLHHSSGCHFILNIISARQGDAIIRRPIVTFMSDAAKLPPSPEQLEGYFSEFRHDVERLLGRKRPHELGRILRSLFRIDPLHE